MGVLVKVETRKVTERIRHGITYRLGGVRIHMIPLVLDVTIKYSRKSCVNKRKTYPLIYHNYLTKSPSPCISPQRPRTSNIANAVESLRPSS